MDQSQTGANIRVSLGIRQTPASWRDYLYWNAELET
jgi:hypothetical protein